MGTKTELAPRDSEALDKKIDQVLEKVGGFGRFQWFIVISYFLINKSSHLISMSLSFLTKVPEEYFCLYEG